MTATSDAITRRLATDLTDWFVSNGDVAEILRLLRADANIPATVRDLRAAGKLPELSRVLGRADGDAIAQVVGGSVGAGDGALILVERRFPASLVLKFKLSQQAHERFRIMGASFAASPFDPRPLQAVVARPATAPFGGVGATGVSPIERSVPVVDQARMAAGDTGALSRYSNPIPGSLATYLATLTAAQRRQQALMLLRRPIASVIPHSYRNGRPSRVAVIRLAAAQNNLDGSTLAAFILAEQRDQSRNEDAADFGGATSLLQRNSSIGLGQVVVSTARREDLFEKLLEITFRRALTHNEIALLLASDEFNIFAVAKYLRMTADRAARLSRSRLPATAAQYPKLVFATFARNARDWPADNVKALGSEYTSTPWDDRLVPAWGEFVYEALRDMRGSGAF